MTPSSELFEPGNEERLRLLMEKYDKMAQDAIDAEKEIQRELEEEAKQRAAK